MNGWIVWIISGVVMVVGGVIALANPLAATLTAEQIAAWIFLIAAVLQIVAIFRSEEWSARLWALVLAMAFLWLGLSLLINPLAGIVTLTLVVAIGFLVSGAAKLLLSWRLRGTSYFWPVLLSGLVSIVLAAMVFFNFPESAAVLLGVMLAIELLISGATIIAFAIRLRSVRAPTSG